MPRFDGIPRFAPRAILVALSVGFLYSGAWTLKLCEELFSTPPALGWDATVDRNLAVVNLSSGEQLRAAVAAANWPPADDVVVMAQPTQLPGTELIQFYYSASYLLYPRPVWLTPRPGRVHHALLVGRSNRVSLASLP